MRKVTLLLGLSLLMFAMFSCGSSKEVAQKQNTPSNLPCPDCVAKVDGSFAYLGNYMCDSEYELADARSIAASNARAELAGMLETFVERVMKNFSQKYVNGTDPEYVNKVTTQTVNVIKTKVKGTPVTCWGTTPSQTKEGALMIWTCVEMTTSTIYDEVVKGIKADDKLRIDFAEEQFKDDFEQALQDFEAERDR